MLEGKAIRDTAKSKWSIDVVEWPRVKGHDSVPAAGDRGGQATGHCFSARRTSEERPPGHKRFKAISIPSRKEIIEIRRMLEIQCTSSCVVPITRSQQPPNVIDLQTLASAGKNEAKSLRLATHIEDDVV